MDDDIVRYSEETLRVCLNGIHNICAPTGTVSILTQTTSGIEPLFAPFYTRRKKVNPNDENVKVNFVDDNGDSWTEYPVLHPKFKEWIKKSSPDYGISFDDDNHFNKWISELDNKQLTAFFEDSPWYGSTANDIDWLKRVELQSILQKYITHSISSTINLPSTVSEKEVSDIYLKAWNLGLKGITVYRDGSRSGVLVTNPEVKETFKYKDAPKRPKSLSCDIHITKYRGEEFVVIVGLYHGNPYEVFAIPNEWNIKPSVGDLIKVSKSKYNLQIKDDLLIEDITSKMTKEEAVITRLLSFGLRHGGAIDFAVEQLRKSEGDITAFSKSIARVLNKYASDKHQSEKCPECSSELVREEGCLNCKSCGYSKCG